MLFFIIMFKTNNDDSSNIWILLVSNLSVSKTNDDDIFDI